MAGGAGAAVIPAGGTGGVASPAPSGGTGGDNTPPAAGGVPVEPPVVPAGPTEQQLLTGTWEALEPIGAATARHECGFGEVNGKMYLVGGRESTDTEEYDPKTNTWKKVGQAPVTLHHFQPVGYKGKLYVGGALTGGFPMEPPAPDFYVFDPANGAWTTDTRLPQGRERGSTGLAVYKDKFYVVSGITNGHWDGWVSWFDVYDPATKTWATLPDAPRPRDHVAVAVAGDKLYVAGGRNSSWKDGKNFSLTIAPVDVFNFTTNQWSTLPNDLPTPRAGNSTVIVGNHLLIIGGEYANPGGGGGDALPTVEALNLATNEWVKLADMTSKRHATSVVLLDNKLFTAAGSVSLGGNKTNTMERWTMP
jgi:N-acetylneuraminic acid mutarotase